MKKIDNTINELKTQIEKFKKEVEKKVKYLDKNKAKIAKNIVDNTITVINISIEKISALVKNVKEDEKVNAVLDKVKAKSKEAIDYALDKIDALAKNDAKDNIDIICDEIMNEFDKLKESDFFKTTKILVKEGYDKINDFLEKPEVQKKIKNAKITTIKYAEKGVEGLKKVLDVDDAKKKKTSSKKVVKTKQNKKKVTKTSKTKSKNKTA